MKGHDRFVRPEHMRVRSSVVRSILLRYRNLVGATVLIETGTYQGATIETVVRSFEEIMTVDISEYCLKFARIRMDRQKKRGTVKGKKVAKVDMVHGNSIEVLPRFLDSIHERNKTAVFWLDAHFSEGVTGYHPDEDNNLVMKELVTILEHPASGPGRELIHAIIIDDARSMGTKGYPSISELVVAARERKDDITIKVEEDSIQIFPSNLEK